MKRTNEAKLLSRVFAQRRVVPFCRELFIFFCTRCHGICTIFVDPLHSKLKQFAQHKKYADIFVPFF